MKLTAYSNGDSSVGLNGFQAEAETGFDIETDEEREDAREAFVDFYSSLWGEGATVIFEDEYYDRYGVLVKEQTNNQKDDWMLTSKYRHDQGRKLSRFDDCDNQDVYTVDEQDVSKLGIYDAFDLGITCPLDDFNIKMPILFILRYNDNLYLVNTEGSTYCRYVAPCHIAGE